jgi:lipopolysaccharide/colanic/teichoic acid biosynthesis glycosyltransferase
MAQFANVVIAALFFSFIPIFGIAPKTLLVIYLIVSFVLVLLWRVALFPQIGFRRKEQALVVGGGAEIIELVDALRMARNAPTAIANVLSPDSVTLKEDIEWTITEYRVRFIIADFTDPRVLAAFPNLYNYLSQGIRFFDALGLYEEVFGRVPLSVIDQEWLARNVSRYSHTLYDTFKRAMDVILSLPLALLSLIFYPFIWIATKVQDGGDVLISMPRIGEGGRVFGLRKFRSMTGNDKGEYGTEGTSKLRVTPVGKFLRVTRLDEIPQLWSVLAGDLSLIGPRPETPTLVALYEKEIPFYDVRHLIKPGLSGWAQLYGQHAHHGLGVEETRNKLSYDLYYIKHRSLTLDLVVALKTIKKLLTRSGV